MKTMHYKALRNDSADGIRRAQRRIKKLELDERKRKKLRDHFQELILQAIQTINLTRQPEDRLEVSANAPIFGPGSSLDSLGLVALLIEVEAALQDAGHDVTLSDARAMSQSQSPFRDVPSLVAFIASLAAEAR